MSLVAHWKLDGDAKDNIGGYDGDISGTSTTTGKLGNALDFDGSNDYVDIGESSRFNFVGGYSISAWLTTNSSGWTRAIMRGPHDHYQIDLSSDTEFRFSHYDEDGDYRRIETDEINTEQWYHVVATWDGNETAFYLDGELVGTKSVSSLNSQQNSNLRFGEDTRGGNNWDGKIDDIRIYDHALSKKEIAELSRAKVLHYKFNENGSVSDASGQGNGGEINGPTFTEDCKIGSGAYEFNGDGDYISMDNVEMDSDSATTMGWFYIEDFEPPNDRDDEVMFIHNDGNSTAQYLGFGDGDMHFETDVNNEGGGSISSSNITSQSWFHFALTFDDGTAKMYIDGSYEGSVGLSDNNLTVNEIGHEMSGGSYQSGYPGWFDGRIDDVRFYNETLSEKDIEEIYQQRASIDDRGNLHSHEINHGPNRRGAETPLFAVGNIDVAALEDNTEVYLNGSLETTINANEYTNINSSIGDIIDTNGKPLYKTSTQTGTPLGWAGRQFAWRNDRYGPIDVHIYSPYDDSEVEVYKTDTSKNTPDSTITVNKKSYETIETDDDNNQWIIESTNLVCVFIDTSRGDQRPLYPTSNEFFGVPSGNGHIIGTEDGTNLSIYYSDGSSSTATIDRGGYENISSSSNFRGSSTRVVADNPIFVESQADSDGGEMTPFTDSKAFADTFVLGDRAEFVVFVGQKEGATVSVYDDTGSKLDEKTVDGGSNDSEPTKLRIHEDDESYDLLGGYKFVCSEPQYAVWENENNDDETIFFGSLENSTSYPRKFDLSNKGVLDGYISEVGPASESLVGWWPLDGDTDDYSGNNNHGDNNGASITGGLGQSAYDFDGSGDYIDTAYYPKSGAKSMSAWIYPRDFSENQLMGAHDQNNRRFYMGWSDSGTFYIGSGDTFDTYESVGSVNEWKFFTIILDGSTAEGYVDTDQKASHSYSWNGDVSDDPVRIGNHSDGGFDMDAVIGDVRIYDRALTTEEVALLYQLTDPREDTQVSNTEDGVVYTKEQFSEDL